MSQQDSCRELGKGNMNSTDSLPIRFSGRDATPCARFGLS